MIRTESIVDFDALPQPTRLSPIGQAHFTSRLHADLCSGLTVTADSWLTAFGRAADHQMVAEFRAELNATSWVAALEPVGEVA